MKKYFSIEVFFEKNRVNNNFLIDIIEKLKNLGELYNEIVFENICVFDSDGKFNTNGMKYLSDIDLDKESVFIKANYNKYFEFGRAEKFDWFKISYLSKDHLKKIETEIIPLLLDNLEMMYLIDYWYHFYQSVEVISLYQVKGLKYDHLPTYNLNNTIKMIDTSQNPGCEYKLEEFNFYPAYKIWFGKVAQDLFDRNHILNYKNAVEIKEIKNNVIEMQLMNNIFNSGSRRNQKRQKDIIKYLGIDKMKIQKW
jgi:hypothetical protein